MGLPNFSADVSSEGVAFWLLLFYWLPIRKAPIPDQGTGARPRSIPTTESNAPVMAQSSKEKPVFTPLGDPLSHPNH